MMFNLHCSKVPFNGKIKKFNFLIPQFEAIQPFCKDINTGDILNDSNRVIFKRVDDFNLFEYVQSFKSDCDVYKLIEKAKLTNDMRLLHVKEASYSDITGLPSDFISMQAALSDAKGIDLKSLIDFYKNCKKSESVVKNNE